MNDPSLTSDRDDFKQVGQAREIVRIARVQRQTCCNRRRSNEQIHRAPAARFAACRGDCGVDAAVRTGHCCIDWKRLERRLGPLQPVLTAGAFVRIGGRVRSGCEFGHRHRRDGDLRIRIHDTIVGVRSPRLSRLA